MKKPSLSRDTDPIFIDVEETESLVRDSQELLEGGPHVADMSDPTPIIAPSA